MSERFAIVFEKLEEELEAHSHEEDGSDAPSVDEYDSIDELRRLSIEVQRPSMRFFSGT